MKEHSDGSTASYYVLPEEAGQLQDLISHRNMNAQVGEIFRACYRYGMAGHSDQLRDAKKMVFYAQAEVARLEKLHQATDEHVVVNPAKLFQESIASQRCPHGVVDKHLCIACNMNNEASYLPRCPDCGCNYGALHHAGCKYLRKQLETLTGPGLEKE